MSGVEKITLITNKITHVEPESIRIDGFKDMFKDVSFDAEGKNVLVCSITSGLALIPTQIAKKIITSELWNDDGGVDTAKIFRIINDEFSYITTNELEEILEETPFKPVNFFKGVCPDSGVCLAFGRESKKITKFFDFSSFDNVTDKDLKLISSNGSNAFIRIVNFEKDGYKAKTVLKTTLSKTASNLFYEYLVGQYINKQCLRFPCFIETYDLFIHSPLVQKQLISSQDIPSKIVNDFKRGIRSLMSLPPPFKDLSCREPPCVKAHELFSLACKYSENLSIMIQHIDGVSLDKMLLNKLFVEYDLFNVLYQIYMPLSTLADEFTHYDLHIENVMIYEPVKGYYFDYEYKLKDDTVVKFKSRYIAKIIDYGRAFFHDSTNTGIDGSSEKINEILCNSISCMHSSTKTFCGEEYGFPFNPDELHFKTGKRNISHDLLLIYRIKVFLQYHNQSAISDTMLTFFQKLEYGKEKSIEEKNKSIPKDFDHDIEYSTEERYEQDPEKRSIFNVKDAHRQLKDMVTEREMNVLFSLGTLIIHESGLTMQFIPNFNPKLITLIIENKLTYVEPKSIRIDGFKNMFTDVPLEDECIVICSITNVLIRNMWEGPARGSTGIALIPNEIAKKIINSHLWNDDGGGVDPDKNFKIINDDEFSYITRNELAEVLEETPFKHVNFFKGICPDSGVCLAFGRESKKITSFFDFATFTYLTELKQIGEKSKNGFIFKLDFNKDDYKASTVLKSTLEKEADNLLYEYLVGKYINKQSLRFPCFVETYEWFLYPDITLYNKFKSEDKIEKDDLKKFTLGKQLLSDRTDIKSLFGFICENSIRIAIMTQYINGQSLYTNLSDTTFNTYFILNHLIFVLFQLYMPLATLSNEFTHYDLHMDNVLIYEPVKGKYIDYEYRLSDKVVKFKSPYIVKIIDYGRSFFHDSTNTGITGSSEKINQTFMEVEEKCDELKTLTENFEFIPAHKSVHSDLRILENLSLIHNLSSFTELFAFCKRIKPSRYYAYTTKTAFVELTNILKDRQRNRKEYNDKLYATMVSLGTLKIYEIDKKMKFIPNTNI